MKLEFAPRLCPLCGSGKSKLWTKARIDESRLTNSAFASRKIPEYMHLAMVECASCRLLYANPVLRQDSLAQAYREAAFVSRTESRYAALTNRRLTEGRLHLIAARESALDIGAGDGAFVEQLLDLGFARVTGVEPSLASIAAAPPAIRRCLRNSLFHAADFPPKSLDLIACFQVLEHLLEPARTVREAFSLLKPGGLLIIVAHDRRAVSARLLGTRSPIFDIEHLQLFDRPTGTALLLDAGFEVIAVDAVRNRYPLDYWLRLAPLPAPIKELARAAARRAGAGDLPITLAAGNLAFTARRPAANAGPGG